MSVKAQALVWDFPCPCKIGMYEFKPNHKYVLIKYADHADHNGKNIYPAVSTVAEKTGYDERTVQRITRDLEEMGFLVADGQGPRGTNKWMLPYTAGGDKLSPLTNCRGDKNEKSLGDIPSGDIPSGDNLSPELKEPEPLNINKENDPAFRIWEKVFRFIQPDLKGNARTYVQALRPVSFRDGILTMGAGDEVTREWMENRMTATVNALLIGILGDEAGVVFVTEAA